ncbi:uncharacterized protein V1510DRAFT_409584 [Dipodascopsis tothii]|uniref:uncharacterized protein n=1 Tax=Dipodascopsis tothii TaxID=44089 RepID=UPI0034CF6956
MDKALQKGVLKELFTLPLATAKAKFPSFVAQVLQIKELSSTPTGPKRFRFVISDSENFVQCMLSSHHNDLVYSQQIARGNFIRVKDYTPSNMKDKLVVILLDVEVMADLGVCERVGQPVPIDIKTKAEPEDDTDPNGSGTAFYGNNQQKTTFTESKMPLANSTNSMGTGGSASTNKTRGTGSVPSNIYAIEGLSPYQNKWTIKARVTFKSEIKHYHNARGEGKLFTVHFLDETAEIRATGFNESVDSLYDLLQEGSVYYVSKCRVTVAKKQFSNLTNQYELVFDRDAEVEKCEEEAASAVPQMRFKFVELAKLHDMEKDTVVDVLGVLQDVRDCTQITARNTGRPYDKRDVMIVDETGYSATVSIWGKNAVDFDVQVGSVMALKGAKINDYNNSRSLSLLQSSSMSIDPDITEAHKLKGWYEGSGRSTTFTSLQSATGGMGSNRQDTPKTILQVKDEQLGMSEQADYFTLKASVVFFKSENFSYPACPTEGCNKKVIQDSDGGWRCEKCDRSFAAPEYRYILMFHVSDYTGQLWLSAFDDIGKVILGRPASELVTLREDDSDAFLEELNKRAGMDWVFRCRAKQDSYQNQIRVRYSALSAAPMNYTTEAQTLAKLIEAYN